MKEPVKFGLILLIFCAFSAGLLAAVNSFTEPVIAEAELKSTLASYEVIFGENADNFEEYDKEKLSSIKEKYPNIDNIFIAKKGDEVVGYGINVNSNGYGGAMTNAIGILLDGDTIAGFRNISNGETKGFGSRITEEEYYSSYNGKSAAAPLEISKDPQAENEIMWLTSATISSKAAQEGSNEAVKVYNEVLKNE